MLYCLTWEELGRVLGSGPESSAPPKPRPLRPDELLERAEELMLPAYVPQAAAISSASASASAPTSGSNFNGDSSFPLLPRRVNLPSVENGMHHITSNKVSGGCCCARCCIPFGLLAFQYCTRTYYYNGEHLGCGGHRCSVGASRTTCDCRRW